MGALTFIDELAWRGLLFQYTEGAREMLAAGPAEDMLKPALIEKLYGVDVDISLHARTGRLTVVPLARTGQP